MNIYELSATDGSDVLVFYDDETAAQVDELSGEPRGQGWEPPQAKIVSAGGGRRRRQSAFVAYTHLLVMQSAAAAALSRFWEENGELLEVVIPNDRSSCFVFNAQCIDMLDTSRSIVERNWAGEVSFVQFPYFHESRLRDRHLFRLPPTPSSVYASQLFVDAAVASGLNGLTFDKVWDGAPVTKRPGA